MYVYIISTIIINDYYMYVITRHINNLYFVLVIYYTHFDFISFFLRIIVLLLFSLIILVTKCQTYIEVCFNIRLKSFT